MYLTNYGQKMKISQATEWPKIENFNQIHVNPIFRKIQKNLKIKIFYFWPLSGPPSWTVPCWQPADYIKIFKKYEIKSFVYNQLNVRST